MSLDMRTGIQKLISEMDEDPALKDNELGKHQLLQGFLGTLQRTMMTSGTMDSNTLFDCAASEALLRHEMKKIEDKILGESK